MKRTLNSWNAACMKEGTGEAWTLAQTRLAEVLRWSSATVEQARCWAAIANDSANAYAERLVAAAISGLKTP